MSVEYRCPYCDDYITDVAESERLVLEFGFRTVLWEARNAESGGDPRGDRHTCPN